MLRKLDWFWMILAIVLTWVVDRYTKLEALKYSSIHYYGPFVFSLQYNSGAMLGLFKQLPDVLRVVTLSTAGAFLFFSFFVIQYLLPTRAIILRIGLAFLIGGIIGNVADRITWGAVIDFVSIKYYKDKVTTVFNIADLMQWIGHVMILVSLFKYADVFWPDANVRKTRWINLKFQLKYCFILTISALSMAMIVSILAYTYLRVTLSTLTHGDPEMLNGYLYPFVLSLCAVTAIFIGGLFIFGKSMSHRVAGPVYALERYIDDLIRGNYRPFKVRKNDDFQQFTAVGLRLKEHMMSLATTAGQNPTMPPPKNQTPSPALKDSPVSATPLEVVSTPQAASAVLELPSLPQTPESMPVIPQAPILELPKIPETLPEVPPSIAESTNGTSTENAPLVPQLIATEQAINDPLPEINTPTPEPAPEPAPAPILALIPPMEEKPPEAEPPAPSLLPEPAPVHNVADPQKEEKIVDAIKIKIKNAHGEPQLGAAISGAIDSKNPKVQKMDLVFSTGFKSETHQTTDHPDERMRITSEGKVGIGTASPEHHLHVVGTAGLSSGTSWLQASDERLKDIVGPFKYGLNEVLKLNPVQFRYKTDNPLELPSQPMNSGFVAQEIQKIIPEAVTQNDKGYLELNVDPIHWAALNAIKEIHTSYLSKTIADTASHREFIEHILMRLDALERQNNSNSINFETTPSSHDKTRVPL